MRNSSLVSTTPVSGAFTVLESFTGVNDTAEEFLTGVNDTGKAVLYRCQRHWGNTPKPSTALGIQLRITVKGTVS